MFSEICKLGPITSHAYGVCMAVGFLLAWHLAAKLNADLAARISGFMIWLMVGAILGARIAYVWEHWQAEFAHAPANIMRIDQGGLMFYGGLIGAIATLLLYCRLAAVNFFKVADLFVAVLPLGHCFGRIGCFLHGCCYGARTDGVLGVCFPAHAPAWWEQVNAGLLPRTAACSLPVLPTQLFEAGANLLLFLAMYLIYRRFGTRTGFASGAYLIGYAIVRFGMEFLRGDPRLAVAGLSIGQTISAALFLAGALILLIVQRQKRS